MNIKPLRLSSGCVCGTGNANIKVAYTVRLRLSLNQDKSASRANFFKAPKKKKGSRTPRFYVPRNHIGLHSNSNSIQAYSSLYLEPDYSLILDKTTGACYWVCYRTSMLHAGSMELPLQSECSSGH